MFSRPRRCLQRSVSFQEDEGSNEETRERNMEKPVERIENCDGEQENLLMHRIKALVTKMRQKLTDKIISPRSIIQCPPKITALFLMAEKGSRFNDEISQKVEGHFKDYAVNMRNVQWTTESPSLIEQNLWTLLTARTVFSDFSLIAYENVLLSYICTLENNKHPLLCLMLWLFPRFANEERMKIAKGIACGDPTTSLLQDRMMYCLACINRHSCGREKTSEMETQFLGHQLAIVEGENKWGDIVSAAIGLLVLISCSKQGLLKDSVINATQKTAHWIADRLTGHDVTCESCIGWAFYALCRYINQVRRLEQGIRTDLAEKATTEKSKVECGTT